jgi:hypothetical protein
VSRQKIRLLHHHQQGWRLPSEGAEGTGGASKLQVLLLALRMLGTEAIESTVITVTLVTALRWSLRATKSARGALTAAEAGA